ncbi:MAG: hypothetical protein RIQ81_1290 [Pseudomonadota bacterium]|jgi:two-component system chemotaxis sensor kinase CheA
MTNLFQILVLSGDPALNALLGDLGRPAKCGVTSIDALPEAAIYLRDGFADIAGVVLDLRGVKGFESSPANFAGEITALKETVRQLPFIVLCSPENASHLSTGGSEGLQVLMAAAGAEILGPVTDAFSTLKSRMEQLEEKSSLESAFIEEATSLLEEVEPLLLALEENPGNKAALDTVFRNIHTIKGSSGFFDTNPIPEFLHRCEDVLSKMKSGVIPVTQVYITVMLKAVDITRQMLESMRTKTLWNGDVGELVKMFDLQDVTASAEAPVTAATEVVLAESSRNDSAAVEHGAAGELPVGETKVRESIQVPVQMLDEFMELSGESTVIRNMVNKLVRVIEKEAPGNRNVSLLGELLDEMHKINSSVQGRLTELRKVPASRILKPLPRAVRDLSKTLGKDIELRVEGESIRLDTAVAQVLAESLVHLVRNAVDHGLESPGERASSGKNARGHLTVSVREEGDEIIAEVADDGGGIDPSKIRRKLVASGRMSEPDANSLVDSRLFAMIFEPGFSTAASVTGISGRGVGLDMVKSSVEKLRGRIEIDSKLKVGTRFSLHLPVPKSVLIVSSLLVQANGSAFAVPQDKIVRLLRVADARELIRPVQGGFVLDFHGDLIPVVDLGVALKLRESMPSLSVEGFDLASFVVIQAEGGVYACRVDAILDSEEIVMKKVGAQLEGRKAFSGATFMGDGTVGLILNVDGIAEIAGVQLRYRDVNQAASGRNGQSISKNDILLMDVKIPGDFGIPMNSVYRLEDFDTANVMGMMDRSVVVYREQSMPLIELATILGSGVSGLLRTAPVPTEGRERVFVLVFRTRKGQFFGCVVDRIRDFITIEGGLSESGRSYEFIKGTVLVENKKVISVLDPEVIIRAASLLFDDPVPLMPAGAMLAAGDIATFRKGA